MECEEEEVILLVDSGTTCSSLMFQPNGRKLSKENLLVSGAEGEGFQVPMFERMMLKLGPERIKESLLYVRATGTHPPGRDLIIRVALSIGVEEGQVKVITGLLSEEEEKDIEPPRVGQGRK